jgi:hypothetical protein
MKWLQTFCIVAMVPAALNVMPSPAEGRIMAPLCTGDGVVRSISIPIRRPSDKRGLPNNDPPGCCVKGCQSGSRKRGCCDDDPREN